MQQGDGEVAIAGVDEAGRGPLAGPVLAAAVVLAPHHGLVLADSKKLTPGRRERLAKAIRDSALIWSIALASVEEIDRLNIHHASLLAMRRALDGLAPAPARALIDGRFVPETSIPCRAIVHGDALEPAVSAASILAKVRRDTLMCELDECFPGYGFARHKGYGTRRHRESLARLGPCPAHRRSFEPLRGALAS